MTSVIRLRRLNCPRSLLERENLSHSVTLCHSIYGHLHVCMCESAYVRVCVCVCESFLSHTLSLFPSSSVCVWMSLCTDMCVSVRALVLDKHVSTVVHLSSTSSRPRSPNLCLHFTQCTVSVNLTQNNIFRASHLLIIQFNVILIKFVQKA